LCSRLPITVGETKPAPGDLYRGTMSESWRVALAAAMGGAIVSGLAACSSPSAALPAASVDSGLMGTHGIVTFVSTQVGWVVAPHPRLHSTAVYSTADGGLNWVHWGTLPGEAGPVALSESAVLLKPVGPDGLSSALVFSSDGAQWESRRLPFEDRGFNIEIQFLADLQHGWLVHGRNPPSPADLFRTTDGGRSWQQLATKDLTYNESGGSSPVFWNTSEGAMFLLRDKSFVVLRTHDSGATWQQSDVAAIDAKREIQTTADLSFSPDLPTMFDDLRGLLSIHVYSQTDTAPDSPLRKFRYVTRTADGGNHWSAAELIRLPATGQLTFFDDRRWLLVGERRVQFTRDSGVTWHEAEGLDESLLRGAWPSFRVIGAERNVAFLGFVTDDIEWVVNTTDAGAHWQAVPLPDVREASWANGRPPQG